MSDKFSFGMEFEHPNINKEIDLVRGFTWDWADHNVVNDDGTATDPTGEISKIGGEFNSSVFNDIDLFCEAIEENFKLFPDLKINHRSHPHIHVGHPELGTLEGYKKFVTYNYNNQKEAYDIMWFNNEKKPDKSHPATKEKVFARPRMPEHVYNYIMESSNMEEAKKAHGLNKSGKFSGLWIKRYGWNTYSYFKNDRRTIEIRTIRPTLDVNQIHEQLTLSKRIVEESLNGQKPFSEIWSEKKWDIPLVMPDFDPFLEYGWDKTNLRYNSKEESIKARKELPTREEFYEMHSVGLESFFG